MSMKCPKCNSSRITKPEGNWFCLSCNSVFRDITDENSEIEEIIEMTCSVSNEEPIQDNHSSENFNQNDNDAAERDIENIEVPNKKENDTYPRQDKEEAPKQCDNCGNTELVDFKNTNKKVCPICHKVLKNSIVLEIIQEAINIDEKLDNEFAKIIPSKKKLMDINRDHKRKYVQLMDLGVDYSEEKNKVEGKAKIGIEKAEKRIKFTAIIASILIFCMAIGIFAGVYFRSDFAYAQNEDGTITITGYSGDSTELVIPQKIHFKKVSAIGNNAFANSNITSLRFAQGTEVKTIFDGAFYGCRSLSSVTFPNSLNAIYDKAFADCSGFTNIIIPANVTAIGASAFASCTNLSSIDMPNGLLTIGANAFLNCGNLETVNVPNTVTNIGSEAFKSCNRLSSIVLESDIVMQFGANVFSECAEDLVIYVPSSVVDQYKDIWKKPDIIKPIRKEALIVSATGFTVDNGKKEISITLPHGTTQLKLGDKIQVSGGATWKLFLDNEYKNEISEKAIFNLVDGNNTAKMTITAQDRNIVNYYDVNIYINHIYTLQYVYNNGLDEPKSIQIEEGSLILNDQMPKKMGYSLAGWYNNGIEWNYETDRIVDPLLILTANWTANSYNVSLNVDSGDTLENNTSTITYDSDFSIVVPTKTGYNFLGWYSGKNGTNTQYTNAEGKSIIIWNIAENDYLLYAKWIPKQYTVTLNSNQGDILENDKSSVSFETEFDLVVPTRPGYSFWGWYSDIEGEGIRYTNVQGKSLINWDVANDNFVLYAKWFQGVPTFDNSANFVLSTDSEWTKIVDGYPTATYFVGRYYSDTHSTTASVRYGFALEAVYATYTTGPLMGMTVELDFNGYRASSFDSIASTAPSAFSTTSEHDNTNYYGYVSSWTLPYISGNYTLSAEWQAITYDITWNLNSGTATTIAHGIVGMGIPAANMPIPTRSGYYFTSWSVSGYAYTSSGASRTSFNGSSYIPDNAIIATCIANWTIHDYSATGSGAKSISTSSNTGWKYMSNGYAHNVDWFYSGTSACDNSITGAIGYRIGNKQGSKTTDFYAYMPVFLSGELLYKLQNGLATAIVSASATLYVGAGDGNDPWIGGDRLAQTGAYISIWGGASTSVSVSYAINRYTSQNSTWNSANSSSELYSGASNGAGWTDYTSGTRSTSSISLNSQTAFTIGFRASFWNNAVSTGYCKHYALIKNLTYTVALSDNTTYTYNVYANGGTSLSQSGATSTNTRTSHTSTSSIMTAPESPWSRTGYRFIGWNTASNGTGTTITPGNTFNANIYHYLYAQWSANNYTVLTKDGYVGQDEGAIAYDMRAPVYRTYGSAHIFSEDEAKEARINYNANSVTATTADTTNVTTAMNANLLEYIAFTPISTGTYTITGAMKVSQSEGGPRVYVFTKPSTSFVYFGHNSTASLDTSVTYSVTLNAGTTYYITVVPYTYSVAGNYLITIKSDTSNLTHTAEVTGSWSNDHSDFNYVNWYSDAAMTNTATGTGIGAGARNVRTAIVYTYYYVKWEPK